MKRMRHVKVLLRASMQQCASLKEEATGEQVRERENERGEKRKEGGIVFCTSTQTVWEDDALGASEKPLSFTRCALSLPLAPCALAKPHCLEIVRAESFWSIKSGADQLMFLFIFFGEADE